MIARAPGKLFLTGAFAVLEGAPAIVVAVDRYVSARLGGEAAPHGFREVDAVLRRLSYDGSIAIDASSLRVDGRKLGLGSSAAATVAAAGAILFSQGEQCARAETHDDASLRARILSVALGAHREVQPNGSGGDVAAAAFGGAVCVRRSSPEAELEVTTMAPPPMLVWRAFALGYSARTSDALARLTARRSTPPTRVALAALAEAAREGAAAFQIGSAARFVVAANYHVAGLEALGRALDLPLVPREVERAREVLAGPGMSQAAAPWALLPSGAGGGDTVVWLGARAPTDDEVAALAALGLAELDLSIASRGVHSPTDPT